MSCATQEVKDLYNLLEHEFFPLDLASKVQPLLTKISKFGGKLASASSVPEVQLSRYIPALEKLVTLRLLQQVKSCLWLLSIVVLQVLFPSLWWLTFFFFFNFYLCFYRCLRFIK